MVRRSQFFKGDSVKIITKEHQPLHEDDTDKKIIEGDILDGFSFTDQTYYVIVDEYLPASNRWGENIFYYGTGTDPILISDVIKMNKTQKTRKNMGGKRRDKTKFLPSCTPKTRTKRKTHRKN